MQKIILSLLILIALTGCAHYGDSPQAPTETSQRILKLRGYDFDEQSFFAAAQARDIMAINAFIDGGINANAQDADGRTVLISAAARGELDVVKALLSRGVDPNVKDNRGFTALSHAMAARYDDVEDALLSQPHINPNSRGLNEQPALGAYVWRDDTARVKRLLVLGADLNLSDADGDTPLHGAAKSGNVEILTLLLDKGANPNAKNKEGGTPLMWAAVYGNEDAARLLLNRGADASAKDNTGVTAAEWASRNERDNVASLLRSKH